MSIWDDFFVAETGASAARAGLLFAGISINMSKILAAPSLPNRALQALALLVSILLVASVARVPDQSTLAVGVELMPVGVAVVGTTFTPAFGVRAASSFRIGAGTGPRPPWSWYPPRSTLLPVRSLSSGARSGSTGSCRLSSARSSSPSWTPGCC